MAAYGYDGVSHGHGHLLFKDVRVPMSSMVFGEKIIFVIIDVPSGTRENPSQHEGHWSCECECKHLGLTGLKPRLQIELALEWILSRHDLQRCYSATSANNAQ